MLNFPKKITMGMLASATAVLFVTVTAIKNIQSVVRWSPAAYENTTDFINLTRADVKWDIRYGGGDLCGLVDCKDLRGETVVSYKRTLPNRTFGNETLAGDQILLYQVQIVVPDGLIAPDLGIHFLNLFASRYEFFVNGELVKSGNGILSENLQFPAGSVKAGTPVEITFKVDTKKVSEPGFDLRSNILIGPLKLLNQITLEKTVKDKEFILWLTIPRLLIAFLFGFGTMLFIYSRDYVFYVAYTVISTIKVPVFFGQTKILWLKTGLSHSELYSVLDLFSATLMFLFVYRFFRQDRPKLLQGFLAAAGISALAIIGSIAFASSQSAALIGLGLNVVYKGVCLVYFTYVSRTMYRYLRYTGRSPSRMYIAGAMFICFTISLVVLPLAVVFSNQYWVPVLLIELLISCVFAACVSTDMGKVRAERDMIRKKMGVHVDEGLVEELIGSEDFIARNVEEAAILFIDIRGFTEMSESSSAQETFDLLNIFHNEIIDCVYEHKGVIDKFMGDSLMAIWGVRHFDKDCALRAASSAIAMSEKLAELNLKRKESGKFSINYGISVHVGPVVAGHIGNERRAEFSVIGSAVNIASRIEGLTGRLDRRILISETVFAAIRDQVIVADLGHHKIRGVQNPYQIYSLIGVMDGRSDVKLVMDPRYIRENVKPWPHVIDEKGLTGAVEVITAA